MKPTLSPRTVIIGFFVLIALVRVAAQNAGVRQSNAYEHAKHVAIVGYNGDAMEPSLSPDGQILLFNSLNDPKQVTKIFWAKRSDDLTYVLQDQIGSLNTAQLQGTPSIDEDGNLYFVSPRTYKETLSTIYTGKFANGKVTGIRLVDDVSPKVSGIVDTDVDVSPDGNTLVVSESQFADGKMKTCRLVVYDREGDAFRRTSSSDNILKSVNSGTLDYAGTLSRDRRTIYFTRALSFPQVQPGIYMATRRTTKFRFSKPRHLAAVNGFAEAPALSPDGNALYYHAKLNGSFGIWRVTKRR